MSCKIDDTGTITVGNVGGTVTPAEPDSGGTSLAPEYLVQHHEQVGLICINSSGGFEQYVEDYLAYQKIEAAKRSLKELVISGLRGENYLSFSIPNLQGEAQDFADDWAKIVGGLNTDGPRHFLDWVDALPPGRPREAEYVSPITGVTWKIPIGEIGEKTLVGGLVFLFPDFNQYPNNLNSNNIPDWLLYDFDVVQRPDLIQIINTYLPSLGEYTSLLCDICGICPETITEEQIFPGSLSPAASSQVAENAQKAPQTNNQDVYQPIQPSADVVKELGPSPTGQRNLVVADGFRASYSSDDILSNVNTALLYGVKDPVRRYLRRFWLYEDNLEGEPRVRWANDVGYRLSEEFKGVSVASSEMFESWDNPSTPGINTKFPVYYEEFVIDANTDGNRFKTAGELDSAKWAEFVNSFFTNNQNVIEVKDHLILGKVYDDVAFEVPVPYDRDQFGAESSVPGSVWADITPEYNFYIQSWETAVRDFDEGGQPNWYDFLMVESGPVIAGPYQQRLDFNGALPVPNLPTSPLDDRPPLQQPTLGPTPLNRPAPSVPISDIVGYLADFIGPEADTQLIGEFLDSLLQRDCIITSDTQRYFNEQFGRRIAFPMHVDIEFFDQPLRNIVELIEAAGSERDVIKEAINQTYNPSKQRSYKRDYWAHVSNYIEEIAFDVSEKKYLEIDMTKFFEDTLGDTVELDQDIAEDAEVYDISELTGVDSNIGKFLLTAKMRQQIRGVMRSFENILAGERSYSEILMYRVTKHRVDANGDPIEEPAKSFWVPSSDKYDVIRLADNQVKYDTRYFYQIRPYVLVIGSKYQYINGGFLDGDPETFKMRVGTITAPSIKLVEVPVYSEPVYVLDRPPIPPQIDIATYKGHNNKLLVRFSPGVGRQLGAYEPITDPIGIERFQESQGTGRNNNLIWFESDDEISAYEVWASLQRPDSYRDFNLARVVDTKLGTATVLNVEPDRVYYLTFCSVDIHGHRSNPTEVYKARIVDNDGAVYFDLSLVDFEVEDMASLVRSGRRYLAIVPALRQVVLDYEGMGVGPNPQTFQGVTPKLGSDPSIFNNTFKVRITSKKTGRKVDLLFDYSLET